MSISDRTNRLNVLLGMIVPVPQEWLGDPKTTKQRGPDGLVCTPCDTYKKLVGAWRKAMKWTDGLDHALAVMLASVTSTKSVGDQLWCKVIGPASCGKSTLCEAVSIAKDYVLAKSTIRGFHSGWGDGEEDHGLIAQVNGKTLVTKDGDTLLQSPNLGQILSEARDVYDTTSRSSYRKKGVSRDYEGIRMTWILCGTSSLRSIDSSELGERFLDCVIMEGIDDELEDEILWRVVNKADRNLAIEADGKPETHQDPEMTEAMQLTGGYVTYLRQNAQDLLSQVDASEESKHYVTRLGKFVAHMRARPSTRQEETAEREFSARLVSQLWRLAKCLAVVLNKKEIDKDVLKRVRRVAMDTARGQTIEIARHLYKAKESGVELGAVALRTNISEDKTRTLLKFLRQIGVVEICPPDLKGRKTPRWRLTEKLMGLYKEVVGRSHD